MPLLIMTFQFTNPDIRVLINECPKIYRATFWEKSSSGIYSNKIREIRSKNLYNLLEFESRIKDVIRTQRKITNNNETCGIWMIPNAWWEKGEANIDSVLEKANKRLDEDKDH